MDLINLINLINLIDLIDLIDLIIDSSQLLILLEITAGDQLDSSLLHLSLVKITVLYPRRAFRNIYIVSCFNIRAIASYKDGNSCFSRIGFSKHTSTATAQLSW